MPTSIEAAKRVAGADSFRHAVQLGFANAIGSGPAGFRAMVAARRSERVAVDLVRLVHQKSVEGSYDGLR